MADNTTQQLDPELIDRLFKSDDAFMAKMSAVKTRIYDNLNVYADSLKEAETGVFTKKEINDIIKVKNNVLKSWKNLEKKLSVDLPKMTSDSKNTLKNEGLRKNEGIFEQKPINVNIAGIDKKVIEDLLNAFNGVGAKNTVAGTVTGGMGGSGLGGLLSGVAGPLLSAFGMKNAPAWLTSLAKNAKGLAPVALIGAGLIWAAMDAVSGILKADEWGTTKVSAAIGAAIGGTSSELEGALKNMGKGTLFGTGVGFAIGNIPGAIAGAIIGAALGAVTGWVGGQNIAEWLDTAGSKIKKVHKDAGEGFEEGIPEGIAYWMGTVEQKTYNLFARGIKKIAKGFTLEIDKKEKLDIAMQNLKNHKKNSKSLWNSSKEEWDLQVKERNRLTDEYMKAAGITEDSLWVPTLSLLKYFKNYEEGKRAEEARVVMDEVSRRMALDTPPNYQSPKPSEPSQEVKGFTEALTSLHSSNNTVEKTLTEQLAATNANNQLLGRLTTLSQTHLEVAGAKLPSNTDRVYWGVDNRMNNDHINNSRNRNRGG